MPRTVLTPVLEIYGGSLLDTYSVHPDLVICQQSTRGFVADGYVASEIKVFDVTYICHVQSC